MAAGAFQIIGGTAQNILFKLTGTGATIIAGNALGSVIVYWVQFAEIAAATPNITLETYDGVTSFFHIKSRALTANGFILFDAGIWLAPNQFLRATASAGNQIDVTGSQSLPNVQG